MNRRFALLLVLMIGLLAACATAPKQEVKVEPPPPPKAPEAPVALAEYFKIPRIGGASFSYDDKLIAYMTDAGGRMDVWVRPIDGGEATQVTHVKGFVHSFAFSPTEDVLIYEADDGGNELPHIYMTNSKGENAKDLTADYPAGRRTGFIRFAEDGKTFLYLSSLRDEKYLDLYEYNMKTGKSTLLVKFSDNKSFAMLSRDHKRFIVTETLSDVNNNLYLVERGSAKLTLLTQHEGDALYDPTAFSKDAKTLYYMTDKGREFMALYSMDLRTKKSTPVLEESWDVEGASFSRKWTYFTTWTNEDGTYKVVMKDAKTGKEVVLPSAGKNKHLLPSGFSNTDRYLAAYLQTDDAPRSLYLIDMKENKVRELTTESLPESLEDMAMVAGEVVRIPSFDDQKVPAFLYKPDGPGPFPAVIDVHGGPTAQSRRNFTPFNQYLVSKGYVVLVPNVRGSTGYGKSYTKLDNLDLGGGPLKDVVACKKWMVENANVDPNKVVVMGGSYGGYMALAAAAFTPKEFAANVDYFGVSDLKSLVESFPPYWAAVSTFIYQKFGDPKNPDHAAYQRDRSPINFVDDIERPLLVVQGENDARVKKDQSDRIVEELEDGEIPVYYLVIKGEGHGFSNNENRLRAYEMTDRFLDRHIFGDTSVKVEE